MNRILDYVNELGAERLADLLVALGILVVGCLIALVISFLVRAALRRTEIDNKLAAWLVGEEQGEVVGDEEDREAHRALQLQDALQDLALDHDVEPVGLAALEAHGARLT